MKFNKSQHSFSLLESDYDTILRQLSERMISNIVRNLVNRGLVESAFDEEKNDYYGNKKELKQVQRRSNTGSKKVPKEVHGGQGSKNGPRE